MEEGEEEFGGEAGVEADAGFGVFGEVDAALDGEEGAEAFFGEGGGGVGEALEEVALLGFGEGEEAAAARRARALRSSGWKMTRRAMARKAAAYLRIQPMTSSLRIWVRRVRTMRMTARPTRIRAPWVARKAR